VRIVLWTALLFVRNLGDAAPNCAVAPADNPLPLYSPELIIFEDRAEPTPSNPW
jgi:hypothetical protein